jgi:glutaredoxin 2
MQEIILVIGLYVVVMGVVYAYKFSSTKRDDLKALYKKKLIRGGIMTVAVFVLLMVYGMFRSNIYGVGMGGGSMGGAVMIPQITTSSMTIAKYPGYYDTYGNGTISDTREYNKKTFSATIRTRVVEEVAKKVEVLIKSSGGRIDSSNVSEKNAYFSFVVPKSNFDTFEAQMRTFVGKKLYSQTVTSQNLLSQKQSIEQNQNNTQESLNSIKKQKEQVEADYTQKINSIKNKIATAQGQISQIDKNISRNETAINASTDQNATVTLQRELDTLSQTRKVYNQQIASYNSEISNTTEIFKSQMIGLGMSLDSLGTTLTNLGVQETNTVWHTVCW